jgi:tetratricopeptide (TPR) repeat protein
VDHLIGRKLSQNYRFAEGVQYQRRALDRDPGFVPARIQLSQDLLRWGEVAEGWQLAEQVNREDGYNVLAYNLVTLRGKLGDFKALEADGIVVRMQADEAEIYGYAALDLLRRAKRELEEKYDVQLDSTVTVEIYPEQKDFAIRTFGMPGGAGFLGVCFGPVITVNSPASQGQNPSNWQSVLWHEFCHAITLRKSRNKMPRWLSEGISVYEERQANPAWGQAMTPQYREMILGGELRPISQLSGAFLQPPSPAYLQFAYFASSLAVEHLVQEHGVDVLRRILDDLAEDVPINAALDRHAGGLEQLDQQFAEFARRRAEALAPQADWAKPELPEDPTPDALEAWVRDHPNSLVGLHLLALRAIEQQAWGTAQELLRKSLELYPEDAAADSAYRMLAQVYREQGDADQERAVLEQLAVLDADASDVYLRLAELYREAEDWESAARNAERLLAVNPLLPAPHRWLVEAADRLDTPQRAVQSYRALLRLDPIDPAGMHYRLARLLFEQGDRTQAKRHVLMALEAAPRYREAHGLLLQIADASEASDASPTAPKTELEETP